MKLKNHNSAHYPSSCLLFNTQLNSGGLSALHWKHITSSRRWNIDRLWSSSQSSWLQIQRSSFDYRRYQIFWEIVDLERGPLSLVSTIEELLGRKSSGSGRENREYGRRNPSRWPRGTLYLQKLTLSSPTSGGSSVGIVRSRTQATEFSLDYRMMDIIPKPSISEWYCGVFNRYGLSTTWLRAHFYFSDFESWLVG
jgi:hypothetical protein